MQVGDSHVEKDMMRYAVELQERAAAKGTKIYLPVDVVLAK